MPWISSIEYLWRQFGMQIAMRPWEIYQYECINHRAADSGHPYYLAGAQLGECPLSAALGFIHSYIFITLCIMTIHVPVCLHKYSIYMEYLWRQMGTWIVMRQREINLYECINPRAADSGHSPNWVPARLGGCPLSWLFMFPTVFTNILYYLIYGNNGK